MSAARFAGKTLTEILYKYAKEAPDALCIADEKTELSYSQFLGRALGAAGELKKLGHKEGSRIMVECSQDAAFLVCEQACYLAGLVFVPVEHRAAQATVSTVEEETAASLFVFDDSGSGYETDCESVSMSSLMQSGEKTCDVSESAFDPDTLCQILFSTGTTGKSKGIELTHGNNMALAENVMYGVEMKPGNAELLPLPLSHSHALRCFYANLLGGGAIVVSNGVTRVKQIFDLIDKYSLTAMDLSPNAASILLKLSKGALAKYDGRLDYIQIGTAPLPEDTKQKLLELLPSARLYNFYGATESGRSCVLDFSKVNRVCCIGKPAKNARFIVTDDNRQEIASSEKNPGLLACAGPMNMRGYWHQEELTAQTMRDGFVFSNDLGYIDEEGYVYVLGRKDDVINYKGINISPDEIEAAAIKYPAIADCALVPGVDETSGQIPRLFIQLEKGTDFDKKEFLVFLKDYVDANKMPKEIEIIDKIPRTSNGKLRRVELRNR